MKRVLLPVLYLLLCASTQGAAIRIFDRLDKLLDVSIASPANGDVLRYNGTKWANAVLPAGFDGSWASLTGKPTTVSGFGITDFNSLGDARWSFTALGLGTLATQNGTFSGTSSGTNTGDQTITLTGNVTGSGTGSFAATIANGAVTLSKMANMATSSLIYRSSAGTGTPEVRPLSQLKTDLQLSGTNTGDQSLSSYVQDTRTISTTAPITGGGDLSANRTFAIDAATTSAPGSMSAADKTKLDATTGTNTGDMTLGTGVATAAAINIGSTGSLVTSNSTSNESNKTLTGAKVADTLYDANGNAMITFTATASAVNGITVTNAATANPATVTIAATGSDSNIHLALTPKGTGTVNTTALNLSGAGITFGGSGTVPATGFGLENGYYIWSYAGVRSISYAGGGAGFLSLTSGGLYGWVSSSSNPKTTPDTSIGRTAQGIVESNSGTLGKFGQFKGGSLVLSGLTTPAAPTLATSGTAGSTSYTYKVVAKQADGVLTTTASAGTTIATGNATLTSGNKITVTISAVTGATSYDIYRTASGGTPSSTGKIGNTTALTFDDTGLAGDSATAPGFNSTGGTLALSETTPALFCNTDIDTGLSWGAANNNQMFFYNGGSNVAGTTTSGFNIVSGKSLGFGGSYAPTSFLTDDGANIIAQRNSTNAQTFRIYKTYTDASNYSRLALNIGSNYYEWKPESAGTGALYQTIINGGANNVVFGVGSTVGNWNIANSTGHLLAGTDNTYDIGASGATRPRIGYFGTSVTIGGTVLSSNNLRMSGQDVLVTGGNDVYLSLTGSGSFHFRSSALADIVTLSTGGLTIVGSAGAAPTAAGQVSYDSTGNNLVYGTGSATRTLAPPTYLTAEVGQLFTVSVSGINSLATGFTTLFTVPSGKTFVLVSASAIHTTVTGTNTQAPTWAISMDSTNPVTVNVVPTAGNVVTGHGTGTTISPTTGGYIPGAGSVVQYNQIQAGAGATVITTRASVVGFYY